MRLQALACCYIYFLELFSSGAPCYREARSFYCSFPTVFQLSGGKIAASLAWQMKSQFAFLSSTLQYSEQ